LQVNALEDWAPTKLGAQLPGLQRGAHERTPVSASRYTRQSK
jgi:hypothetical protein